MSDLQNYLNDPEREKLIPEVRKKIDELGVAGVPGGAFAGGNLSGMRFRSASQLAWGLSGT